MSYSNNLILKLEVKNYTKPYLVNAPDKYSELFPSAIVNNNLTNLINNLEWVQVFYKDKNKLQNDINSLKNKLSKEGQLWISWPKKSSKVETNLNDQIVRDIGLSAGLVDVKVVSINEIWSGLKFIYRKADR